MVSGYTLYLCSRLHLHICYADR